MRLAVGEPTAHRSPDARRDLGVEHVEVEADVDEAGPRDPRQRLAHGALDADPVELTHREHGGAQLAQQVLLALVELPHADERDAGGIDRRERPRVALEAGTGEAEHRGEHHPVHVPARRGVRAVEIAVRVDPEHAARAVEPREPPERAERHRVVAAEHERPVAVLERTDDELCDLLARLLDLRQEPRLLVAVGDGLGDGSPDVALVHRGHADLVEPRLEPRVADRRRPHVDAAAALAEIEWRTDDRNRALVGLSAHGARLLRTSTRRGG